MAGCGCGCGGGCAKQNPIGRRNQVRVLARSRTNPADSSLSPGLSLLAVLAMGVVVVAAYSRLPQT